jgi:hypothetical protein
MGKRQISSFLLFKDLKSQKNLKDSCHKSFGASYVTYSQTSKRRYGNVQLRTLFHSLPLANTVGPAGVLRIAYLIPVILARATTAA